LDPWASLESYARLDGTDDAGASGERSLESFRRAVVVVSSRLGRTRDGFVRHTTSIRASPLPEENQWQPLLLWLGAATTELVNARRGLLRTALHDEERLLADEFLSLQLWTVLTDCARALSDTRRALEDRGLPEPESVGAVEKALACALADEIAYRHHAGFPLADPASAAQLERLLARRRWLKKHFERVLFLNGESFQVVNRFSGWFTALAAMLAYLWFLVWQLTLQRHPVAIGSGVVVFAAITAVAYASRERLKEVGRNWLAGRAQRMFAQRVTRYRLPTKERQRAGALVVSARESFSQSITQKPEPVISEHFVSHDVTLLRFVHRGVVTRPSNGNGGSARQVRLIYRLDLSPLFPRLHDAVRGLASLDARTGRITIVDVPRNYEIPLRAKVEWDGGREIITETLVLNKNGLLRLQEPVMPGP
jgi:hypothetical protein